MKDLNKLTLKIPNLWEKEWESVLSKSGGKEKVLLEIQYQIVCLLKNIKNTNANPARLAWLSIWTRTFSIIEGSILANSKNAIFILEALSRILFECELHLFTILDPIIRDCSITRFLQED